MISNDIKTFLISDFAGQIRNYALNREANINCKLPSINDSFPKLVPIIKNIVGNNRFFIRDYLTHEDWAFIIYLSYFTLESEQSILLKHFPMFNTTNSIKRGGLNLYKRDGWCTHVITGLFFSNICIPEKTVPLSIPNVQKESKVIFENFLPKLFSKLDSDDILLYRVGTLIHDLGVIDGVENHDYKGIKYVKPALIELGIDENWLLLIKSKWEINSFTYALELFVGQHSFISKVYSEFGLNLIREILKLEFSYSKIKNKFLKNWVFKKSLTSLTLFLIGDIGSVRDELLNTQTLKKIIDSEVLLTKMLDEKTKSQDDFFNYGLNRLKEFLEIEDETIILKSISNLIMDEEFIVNIGRIQRLDYFLTYIKQISQTESRLIFMERIIQFLNSNVNWFKSQNQELNFSPHISMNVILCVSDKNYNDWYEMLRTHLNISKNGKKVIAKFQE